MNKLEQLLLNIKVQEYIENLSSNDIKKFFKDNFSESALVVFKEALIEEDINKLGNIVYSEYMKFTKTTLLPEVQADITSGKLSINSIEKLLDKLYK